MQSEYILLSLLGPRPVFWYDEKFDEVLCAWNGLRMTQAHALMQISSFFMGSGPTPEMRRAADSHLYYLWSMGAFEDSENWEHTLKTNSTGSSMFQWYKRKLQPVYQKYLTNITPGEAYNWLGLKDCYKPINT
jgi:hypothetical protein